MNYGIVSLAEVKNNQVTMKWYQLALNSLFPPFCCLCHRLMKVCQPICTTCQKQLPFNLSSCHRCAIPIEMGIICGPCLVSPPPFISCIAPFHYQPPISSFIIQLKFHHQLKYAETLGNLLAENLSKKSSLPEALIPVPLHNARLRQRGFNQAIEIAKPLTRRFKIPLLFDHCVRQKNTIPQTQLTAYSRRKNLAAAFTIHKKIVYQHVAIIDDVMTTGQTVRMLSATLQEHGVEKIEVWCCARVREEKNI